MNNEEHQNSNSDSELSLSFEQQEFNRIYTNQLWKKQKMREENQPKVIVTNNPSDSEDSGIRRERVGEQHNQEVKKEKQEEERYPQRYEKKAWDVYQIPNNLVLDTERFNSYILHLPIFKKKQEVLNNIIRNQVVLVTGQTGCGKSTQVPRLIYQYIRETNLEAKIICVQPRRLAVKNLHKLLTDQIPEKGAVGYHIAMQTYIKENTKILFMTNGIFLQRLVHGTQFFKEYPFIVLDQVHERDIDTDFILLSVKRILREHPQLRVILMSATIDNKLFQYYFAQDEIDTFMTRENFYKRFIKLEEQTGRNRREQQDDDDGFKIERVGEEDELYKEIQMEYLKAKYPCPTVNVTEKGKYKKEYFYLDTLNKYFQRPYCMKWGSVGFVQKSPSTSKQIFETACVLLQEIMMRTPASKNRSNESVLIFLPGLGQIEYMTSEMGTFFGKRLENFEIIKCHSTILNDQITKKLHALYKEKFKVIIATNIAESSITVFGIKYIIDFCLSKEINFNQKSRMENLELVWASKASCEQRAGRTGRVCDGLVFRLVQKAFYDKLPQYSTPQIQRSSLDKLILRIKLIHENQNGTIFEDPGEVLGTAIQPPNLKHIDQAIKSLILCGGLRVQGDKLILTKLGRIYVDIPLDIIYCKMLIFSMLMGTFSDILILVCILSQNKNAFRKSTIERYPLDFFEIMSNEQRCDFTALIQAYKNKEHQYKTKYRDHRGYNPNVQLDIYYQTRLLKEDVEKRIRQRDFIKKIFNDDTKQDLEEKFKFTIAFGFLTNLIKVGTMIYDDKQEKRYKLMKKQGITVRNTIILLNSDVIRKSADQNEQADNRLKKTWIQNIATSFRLKPQNMSFTLSHGISFLHFKEQTDLNKFLFVKFMEKKRGVTDDKPTSGRTITLNSVLPHLGDIDYMEEGNTTQMFKDHKVNIDNFSGNRIVAVNKQNESFEFPIYRLLITNSITQQSTRLSCRYTSLLPDISNLETILHLAFYPFIILLPDKKRTRYDSIYLKRKMKLHINYELTDDQIADANKIREIIKELMDMSLFLEDEVDFDNVEPVRVTEDGRVVEDFEPGDENQMQGENVQYISDRILGTIQKQKEKPPETLVKKEVTDISAKNQQRIEKMRKFWSMLKAFIIKQRKPVIQEEKWQELYFQEKKISMNFSNIKHERLEEKQYMNPIKTFDLRFSFFSSNFETHISRQERYKEYENWKMAKYKSVKDLQELATDHDPYLICATCNIKIAKLNKVGPINGQYFRELFEYLSDNVQPLVYNELGDYFCSMLMTIYMEKEYDVYGCKNGHHLAIKFKDEKRLKILAFSPLNILYTDGTLEQQPEFESMQYKRWREKFEQSKINKMKKVQENFCFVCRDKFRTIKQMEAHIKNQYHEANMRDFTSSIPSLKRAPPKDTNPY